MPCGSHCFRWHSLQTNHVNEKADNLNWLCQFGYFAHIQHILAWIRYIAYKIETNSSNQGTEKFSEMLLKFLAEIANNTFDSTENAECELKARLGINEFRGEKNRKCAQMCVALSSLFPLIHYKLSKNRMLNANPKWSLAKNRKCVVKCGTLVPCSAEIRNESRYFIFSRHILLLLLFRSLIDSTK